MSRKSTASLTALPAETPQTDNISSQELFQGQQEICIEHGHQVYRLRITRQRKLILTK